MSEPFAHPETGEILETEAEWRAALEAFEERLAVVYRARGAVLAAHAERFPAAAMPSRTRRTDTQEKVIRCPRCGQTYSDATEAP